MVLALCKILQCLYISLILREISAVSVISYHNKAV